MDIEAKIINPNIYLNTVKPKAMQQTAQQMGDDKPSKSFADIFSGEIEKTGFSNRLQFSKHANTRLNSRDISLTSEQIKRVEDGVTQASAKGVRDSLVLVDNIALVVNVKSKTVITAVDRQADKNIFTNIDGAVIV